MLLTALIAAPALVATDVQAFGLYAGDTSWPSSDATFRTGTLVIVRRTMTDGTTVTDLRTTSIPSPLKSLRSVGGGEIIRDAKGNVQHIEVYANAADPRYGNEGKSVWDRTEDEKGDLLGWSESAWEPRHKVSLPRDGVYSLGIVEALTYRPDLTTWRAPNPAGQYRVSLGISRPGDLYSEYSIGEATEGTYGFQGRTMRLRVRPIFWKGDPPTSTTVNGRKGSIDYAATALFDDSGRLVGLGFLLGKSDDLDSQNWGGKTGNVQAAPPWNIGPNPFAITFTSSFAASIPLSPAEKASLAEKIESHP